jgi:predicted short-subunit dehydrogenase-like oxidoreductase (DUF2520 family)
VAVLLEKMGHRVEAVSGGEQTRARALRYLPFTTFVPATDAHKASLSGKLVIIGVPDDSIAAACSRLAADGGFRSGQRVLHLSGSVGLDALEGAESLGAQALSLHPLQSFPNVDEGIRRLPGSGIAITARDEGGYAYGEALGLDLGGRPFRLSDEVKPLYHAAAVFCSNYLVAVEGVAEDLFRLAGLEDPVGLFGPLARTALEATLESGARAAITGPAARGDSGTIRRNLDALAARAPETVTAYVALARVALGLAVASGRLDEGGAEAVREVLDQWR